MNNKPQADFTPTQNTYKKLTPFKGWVLTNFPFVAEDFDALTNYEFMSKIGGFLNDLQNNQSLVETDMTNIFKAYQELQDFVNNYFNNLDVQSEINTKLDLMAQDGTLTNLISKYMSPFINDQNEKIQVLTSRVNELSTLPDGSTTGDAELADIRVGFDGEQFSNAGNAVRNEDNSLSGRIENVKNKIFNSIPSIYRNSEEFTINEEHYLNSNLEEAENTQWNLYTIPVVGNEKIKITGNFKNTAFNAYEYLNGNRSIITVIPVTDEVVTSTVELTVPLGVKNLLITSYALNESYTNKFQVERLNLVNLNDYYNPKSIVSNLINNYNENSYVDYLTGQLISNTQMIYTDFIEIDSTLNYLYPWIYVQLAFYNNNKEYISGINYNPASNYPATFWNQLTIPTNAKYVRLSTRKSNKNLFILTTLPSILLLDTIQNVNTNIIEKQNVISDLNDIIYNYKFEYNLPEEFLNSNFNISNNMANCTGNGYIEWNRFVTMDKSIISCIAKLNNNSVVAFGYCPVHYNVNNTGGCYLEINVPNKTVILSLFGYQNGPKQQVAETTFDFDIDGENYYIEIEKNTTYNLKVKIYNADCPDNVITLEGNSTIGEFRCWGGARYTNVSGTSGLISMRMISTGVQYPQVAIFGDSFIENNGRPKDYSFGRIIYNLLDGDCYLSGHGGGNITYLANYRLPIELKTTNPMYTIIEIGANDNNIDTFKNQLNNVINLIKQKNSIPVLCTIPRRLDNDNINFIEAMNPYIRNLGYKYIDIAYALSTGDGITLDLTKINNDNIHPNNKGAEAIVNWTLANLPELFLNHK